MTSLEDDAINHPLWAEFRVEWGYEERLKKSQEHRENEDTDENRKASEDTGKGSVETCQDPAPLPLSQWAYEHSRAELMRC